MQICELYKSIQGEGVMTGQESIFVRTSGCNLRCDYCDTPFASWHPEGEKQTVDEILQQCRRLECRHVVITGGEPMVQPGIVPLTGRLHEAGFHTTIETAGTIFRNVCCDLMSISPKRANSTPSIEKAGQWAERHDQMRHVPQVINRLIAAHEYQFKFVIDQPADCEDVLIYLDEFPAIDRARVLLMPQGVEQEQLAAREPWIDEFCQQHGFKLCPRKHIEWFGNQRGT